MNNKCENLKIKLDRSLFCKKKNKVINIRECFNCKYKDYVTKCHELKKLGQKVIHKDIKKKSSKLAYLEKNRYSILTNDLEYCIICGKKKDHLHEVFPGAYRQRSIKENMVIPLCFSHHTEIHKDIELSLYWKRLCQQKFEQSHTRDEFIKIFGRSYL